jgi:hypothetical protein
MLGWAPLRVLVIDEDLGHSASGADARPGFTRLVSEVGLDHVGIVLGIEMSRLARSGREWHQLLGCLYRSGSKAGGRPPARPLFVRLRPWSAFSEMVHRIPRRRK